MTRLKNMLICHHLGLFFQIHAANQKKNCYHFEMKKIALIINPYLLNLIFVFFTLLQFVCLPLL